MIFSYPDAQILDAQFSYARFWEYTLHSLYERAIAPKSDSQLAQAYRMCQENGFTPFVLEHIIAQAGADGWRLVAVLLDEFSDLLYHPVLNCAEFFGSLRSLASRSRGALALVVASRRSLASLSDTTQHFSRTGSPVLEFPRRSHSRAVIRPGGSGVATPGRRPLHDQNDRCFIMKVAGGHPFLVQVAASALWEAYEDEEGDPTLRRERAGQRVHDGATLILRDMWRRWSPAARRAFAAVALTHINSLEKRESPLKQRAFYVERLIRDTRDFESELRLLSRARLCDREEDRSYPQRLAGTSSSLPLVVGRLN